MELRDIIARVQQTFSSAVVSTTLEGPFLFVQVKPASLKEVMSFCVHDASMKLDFLDSLTAVDDGQDITVIYQLFSTILAHRFNIKVSVSRHEAKFPSMTGFWRAANAYEREAAEMFGIKFDGHPALDRLLLPEDWQGHPLRKDYVFPEEYKGVEHRRTPLRKEHARP